jgi:hypothetical protein
VTPSRAVEDHYATLGVSRDAPHAEIRRGRNRLLRQYHPDLNPGDVARAQKKTVAILLAAKVLLDDDARREHDRNYGYVFGNRRPATDPSPEDREYVLCTACRRPSQWKRNYCIYCGAATEETNSTAQTSHRTEPEAPFIDLRMKERTPRSWPEAGLHFGCGAVLGAFLAAAFGLRLVGASGFEKESSFVIIALVYVLGCGLAAAVLGGRFWEVKSFRFFLVALWLSAIPLVYIMRAIRRWTHDDGQALLATAVVLLLGGVTATVLTRKFPLLLSKIIGRRPD